MTDRAAPRRENEYGSKIAPELAWIVEPDLLDRIWGEAIAAARLEDWPSAARLLAPEPDIANLPLWYLPIVTARLYNLDDGRVTRLAAALRCLALATRVVDDMIDGEAHGYYFDHGCGGSTAAMMALQAAAGRLIAQSSGNALDRDLIRERFDETVLRMAKGAYSDLTRPRDEPSYWEVYRQTNRPLFELCFFLGPASAGLFDAAALVESIAWPFAMALQLEDDIGDAMTDQATLSDWRPTGRNCAIIFAETVDHPERDRFVKLKKSVDDPEALREARRILVRCGALGYCLYQIADFLVTARRRLDEIAPPNPEPLRRLIDHCGAVPRRIAAIHGLPDIVELVADARSLGSGAIS